MHNANQLVSFQQPSRQSSQIDRKRKPKNSVKKKMFKLTKFHKQILYVIITTFLCCLYWFIICPYSWAYLTNYLEKNSLSWMSWPLHTFWIVAIILFATLLLATYISIRSYQRYSNNKCNSSTTSTTQIVQSSSTNNKNESDMESGVDDHKDMADELHELSKGQINSIAQNDDNKSMNSIPVPASPKVKSEVFMYILDDNNNNNNNNNNNSDNENVMCKF